MHRQQGILALNPLMLVKLLGRLKEGDAIASMGYPDIIFPPDELAAFLGDRISELKYRPESQEICARHGLKGHPIPDAESLFELFGASLDVYDIVNERGCEIVLDLNYPVPANACEQYDYVLDVGTSEHCFNIAQAVVNMACMAKVGGIVMHENPFNWGNHGFYNLCPTWYHDFYTDNGFKVLDLKLLPRGSDEAIDVPAIKRFKFLESEANILAIVQRTEVKDIHFPVQAKYRGKQ
jgi:hypothetical protein